jgi:hypothetical protein
MRRFVLPLVLVVAVAVAASPALAAKVPLRANLTGAAEVPQAGQSGTGKARITLNQATGRVCWKFTQLSGLGGAPNAAHIHRGRTGVAGPVVVPLGAVYRAQGCTSAAKSLIRAIENRPGRYYVNLHNEAYQSGTVRGQLRRA